MWVPMNADRKFNGQTFLKSYSADIKTIFDDDIKQGGFSNRKVNVSGGGGNRNNNNISGGLFEVKCHKCGKKGPKATDFPDKQDKGSVNDHPWYLVQGDPLNSKMTINGRSY